MRDIWEYDFDRQQSILHYFELILSLRLQVNLEEFGRFCSQEWQWPHESVQSSPADWAFPAILILPFLLSCLAQIQRIVLVEQPMPRFWHISVYRVTTHKIC